VETCNPWRISHRQQMLEVFNTLKINALLVDYRGYGLSQGKFGNEQKMYQDAETIFNFLKNQKEINEESIIIWGKSLGASIAAHLAQYKNIHSLILQTPFYSMHQMAKSHYPIFPTKLLLRYKFETNSYIKNVNSKILFIHSKSDEIVPFNQAKKLYNESSPPKQFLIIEGDHNNAFINSYNKYIKGLKQFLE
jgi:alpha/beta superfamily hydrolase